MRYLLLAALLLAVPSQAQDALEGVVINEILADPNGANESAASDTDGDGAAETDDEFAELYNGSATTADISGWQLFDGFGLRHTFDAGTLLLPGDYIAVVSGYDVDNDGTDETPPEGSNLVVASEGGLGLNNGDDTVFLYDPVADQYVAAFYNATQDAFPGPATATQVGSGEDFGSDLDGQSIQRTPDGADAFLVADPTPGAENATLDGPATISVRFSDQSNVVTEGDGEVFIGVTLTTTGDVQTDRDISVTVEQVSGDADDADFVDTAGRVLVFPSGTTSGTQLFASYTLIDDTEDESTETKDLGLFATSPGTSSDPDSFGTTSVTLVILDNDGTAAAPGRLVITEIMYNPSSSPEGDAEWFEIANTVDEALDIGGFTVEDIGDGVATFPDGATIGPFEIAVVISDDVQVTEFQAAWGSSFPILQLDFDRLESLANSPSSANEILILRDERLTTVDSVNFDDSGDWPADNNSASIYLNLTDDEIIADGASLNDDGTNWALSVVDGGLRNPGSRQNDPTATFNGTDVGSPGLVNNDSVLPVEMAEPLAARQEAGALVLTWATASETNNAYFEVLALAEAEEAYAPIGRVDGAGTTSAGQQYELRAEGLSPGTYRLRLRQVDLDGTAVIASEVEASVAIDGTFQVSRAVPNPTATSTEIRVAVARTQQVSVVVYDVLGRAVATAIDGRVEAQQPRSVSLGSGLAPGAYLVVVTGESFRETRRFTVTR